MTVAGEQRTLDAIRDVKAAIRVVQNARVVEREAKVRFMDEALALGWSWERVGRQLGQSGTAVRRYYERNRRRTHGGDL